MRAYLVECFSPGVTRADVEAAARQASRAAARLSATGRPVVYVSSLLMATDEVVLHMFRAPDPEIVREASRRARLDFARVVESVLITAKADRTSLRSADMSTPGGDS